MTHTLKQSFIGGIIATMAMTAMMMIAPMMGMPKMSPPSMLAMMMGMPIAAGWLMHFMIGIIFALSYAFFFNRVLQQVQNPVVKGAIFGIIVFLFAQIMMALMGRVFSMPPMEGNPGLMMMGSLVGHMVYGIVVSFVVKNGNK